MQVMYPMSSSPSRSKFVVSGSIGDTNFSVVETNSSPPVVCARGPQTSICSRVCGFQVGGSSGDVGLAGAPRRQATSCHTTTLLQELQPGGAGGFACRVFVADESAK